MQSVIVLLVLFVTVASAAQQYQSVSRDAHNPLRKRHHSPPLTLSEDLNNRAVQCAQYYANKGKIDHKCPYKNGAGENLYAQWGGSASNDDVARRSTNSWYSEVSKHDYDKDWQPASGHFSQIVWKSSMQLGFGVGRSGNMIVACALYAPAGNVIGKFKENVLKP